VKTNIIKSSIERQFLSHTDSLPMSRSINEITLYLVPFTITSVNNELSLKTNLELSRQLKTLNT